MIQLNNTFRIICLYVSTVIISVNATTTPVPVVESVMQNQFPTQPAALLSTTEALSKEYEHTGNVASLIFYAYGLLRQATYFSSVNDIIKASEYAKNGFFYLDEAVDANGNKPHIRYLRARIDAYLPVELGRCVITIEDTEHLLKEKENLSEKIISHINKMRMLAFKGCKKIGQQNHLTTQLKGTESGIEADIATAASPPWDIDEVTQIIIPLIKGE